MFQIAAISEQASESAGEHPDMQQKTNEPLGWKFFDIRAVVSATEDLLHFIISEKGWRVRVFLLRDIINAVDAFIEDEVLNFELNEKLLATDSEVCLYYISCLLFELWETAMYHNDLDYIIVELTFLLIVLLMVVFIPFSNVT